MFLMAREPCLCTCTSSAAQLMTKSFSKLIVNSLCRYMNISVGTRKAVRGISPQNSRINTKQLPLNCTCWKSQNAVSVTPLTLANYHWLVNMNAEVAQNLYRLHQSLIGSRSSYWLHKEGLEGSVANRRKSPMSLCFDIESCQYRRNTMFIFCTATSCPLNSALVSR